MDGRVKFTVTMEVTESQGLALQAMFDYWNLLAGIGSSRVVAFMVDGDGNFKPNCEVVYGGPVRDLTDDLASRAVVRDENGDRTYDFDPIAWAISKDGE